MVDIAVTAFALRHQSSPRRSGFVPDIFAAVLVAPLVESANTEEPLGWRLVRRRHG